MVLLFDNGKKIYFLFMVIIVTFSHVIASSFSAVMLLRNQQEGQLAVVLLQLFAVLSDTGPAVISVKKCF